MSEFELYIHYVYRWGCKQEMFLLKCFNHSCHVHCPSRGCTGIACPKKESPKFCFIKHPAIKHMVQLPNLK